jgi:hypothetical protein
MGLVSRGERNYYYRSERIDGRVVTRYCGSGEVALVLDHLGMSMQRDLRRHRGRMRRLEGKFRAQCRAARERLKADRDARRELERGLDRFSRAVRAAFGLMMRSLGFHQHARGQWRRRREMPKPNPDICPNTQPPSEAEDRRLAVEEVVAQFHAVWEMAGGADPVAARTAMEAFGELLDRHPEAMVGLLGGDPAKDLERVGAAL